MLQQIKENDELYDSDLMKLFRYLANLIDEWPANKKLIFLKKFAKLVNAFCDAGINIPEDICPDSPPPIIYTVDFSGDVPAVVNGAPVTDLKLLRPSTTVDEIKMRMENSVQRFITQEGVEMYLSRAILSRIRFEELRSKRGQDKTINLPNRHQVRLRVRADGQVKFRHFHKRGAKKRQEALLKKAVKQEEVCPGTSEDKP